MSDDKEHRTQEDREREREASLRWHRIEATRLLGAQLADLLAICLEELGQRPELWPTRQVSNTLRLYAGLLPIEMTSAIEREIRAGMRERWNILAGRETPSSED